MKTKVLTGLAVWAVACGIGLFWRSRKAEGTTESWVTSGATALNLGNLGSTNKLTWTVSQTVPTTIPTAHGHSTLSWEAVTQGSMILSIRQLAGPPTKLSWPASDGRPLEIRLREE